MDSVMSEPEISVIIPVYNKKKYLDKCLNSVIHQTYSNIEVIVIDDGSTDGSTSICKRYSKEDDRINLIIKENAGVSSARNLGIRLAKGDWLLFLDSDDFLELNALEELLTIAKKTNSDIVYYGCNIYKDEDLIRSRNVKELRVYDELKVFFNNVKIDPASACLNFTKRKIVKDNNLFFNESMKYNEDVLFVYSLYCHIQRITIYNKALYNMVLSTDSVSRSPMSIKVLQDNLLFLAELCNYVREFKLKKVYKKKINILLKSFFIKALYFQERHKYIDELQEVYDNLYRSNKDIFYTQFSRLAYINIEIVIGVLRIKHHLTKSKYET